MLENTLRDLRFGASQLARRPGFTLLAVLALALGIGAATSIFSVVKAVLLKPPPFAHPDRLVMLWESDLKGGQREIEVSYQNFLEWRKQNHIFEDVAAISSVNLDFALTGHGQPQQIEGTIVSAGFFPVLGVAAGGASLFDFVFGARPHLSQLRARLAATEGESPCEYAELVNEYDAAGGYAAEARTERILSGLGFAPGEWDLPPASLSGGQRTRAGLARALHTEADLLLLDEPTNHLDVAAREWLEDQLASRGACVLVSHDRTLLRRVANRVLEIERGRVTLFDEGYDDYRARRALIERQAWENYDGFQRRKAAAEQAAQRRSRLAVQVAAAPPGERSSPFYRAKAARVARTARLLRERADHSTKVEKPWEEQPIPVLEFAGARRSGDVALSVRSLAKSYPGKSLFANITFDLARGRRLAITGPNGSGKTTLLRVLLGLEPADGGTVRFGAHVAAGYYAQDAENLDRVETPCKSAARVRWRARCWPV